MKKDIRNTKIYRQAESYFRGIHAPGQGQVTDAADVCVEPGGFRIALTGTVFGDLSSAPARRICIVSMRDGSLAKLPCPENSDWLPRWSPDGAWLAFLSDRREYGNSQLFLAASANLGKAKPAPAVDGFVEYLHWAPDGRRILLGVAGFGADLAGAQGGGRIATRGDSLPEWLPDVDTGEGVNLWRCAYVYDMHFGTIEKASPAGLNCWEANWLGGSAFLAVTSDSHSEGSWYRAQLIRFDLHSGDTTNIYSSPDQLGIPAASPSGGHACIVEAVCSDRLIVCGSLKLIDLRAGTIRAVDTDGVEVTHVVWRDDDRFVYAGHRGLETICAEYSITSGRITTHWCSAERTFGSWYPSCWPSSDGVVAVGESYAVAPELVEFSHGRCKPIRSFSASPAHEKRALIGAIEPFTWQAPDGLDLQGWLVRPPGEGPFPVVMDIHGGPVWACRNRWAGRLRGAELLAGHGVASFYPNPRGSSGRGQEFARLVKGDMGGNDTRDYLSGCDALVARRFAEAKRIGVTGISYGGFMTCWLTTQDNRFVAAAAISCISDWYSQHRTSQIPFFDQAFLGGSAYRSDGPYFERSPVMFAANASTPTLQLTGALDQNTPPTQALEFHRSLLEHGVRSELVTYPLAGHGIRTFPEVIDATARYVHWFLSHFAEPAPGAMD